MEPIQGSTASANAENIPVAFLHHRAKNLSADNDTFSLSSIGNVDSGYVSSNCITPGNTPITLNSASMCKQTPNYLCGSDNLGTIEESSEHNDSMKLTPVTQNIKKISKFHITTPKSNDNVLLTGTKRGPIGLIDFGSLESTPKKTKLVSDFSLDKSGELRLGKIEKFRIKNRRHPFRQKLKSAPDLDTYFQRNNIENVHSSRKHEISPIIDKYSVREKRTPLSNATNSILQSSTPKSCGYRANYYTGQAKYKPSSVKKLLAFTENQFDCLLKSGQAEETPTKKSSFTQDSFEFYEKDVKAIYDQEVKDKQSDSKYVPSFLFNEECAQKSEADVVVDIEVDVEKSQKFIYSDLLEKDESQTDEKEKVQDIDITFNYSDLIEKDESQTDEKGKVQDIDITNIELEVEANHETNFFESSNIQNSADFNPNFDIKSNVDLSLDLDILCEQEQINAEITENAERCVTPPVDNKQMNVTGVKSDLPKTPTKIKLPSIENEKFEILYPTIPRTPYKNHAFVKRCDHEVSKKIQFKQPREQKLRKFYGGITHLNIIAKLEPYTVVLEKILNMLSSQDLVAMTKVSKNWRRIIRANQHANNRRKEFMRKWKSTKENKSSTKIETKVFKSQSIGKEKDSLVRAPFSQSNFRIDRKRSHEIEKSPPVSPSKRKFYENQKVVRTLGSDEKLVKCPRCERSSLIINSNESTNEVQNINTSCWTSISNVNTDSNANNQSSSSSHRNDSNNNKGRNEELLNSVNVKSRNILTSQCRNRNFLSFDNCTPTTTSPAFKRKLRFSKSKSVDTAFLPFLNNGRRYSITGEEPVPYYPYGECTGLTCKFKFCLQCLCEYHPGKDCKISATMSPSKEDVQNGILQLNSPYSPVHRNDKGLRRKSLKRLCF